MSIDESVALAAATDQKRMRRTTPRLVTDQ
jgi:hypothetical protein